MLSKLLVELLLMCVALVLLLPLLLVSKSMSNDGGRWRRFVGGITISRSSPLSRRILFGAAMFATDRSSRERSMSGILWNLSTSYFDFAHENVRQSVVIVRTPHPLLAPMSRLVGVGASLKPHSMASQTIFSFGVCRTRTFEFVTRVVCATPRWVSMLLVFRVWRCDRSACLLCNSHVEEESFGRRKCR